MPPAGPLHLLPAAMLVFLVLAGGCTQPPVADFEADPAIGGPAPMQVTFHDKSTG